VLIISSCKTQSDQIVKDIQVKNGAVASAHALASQVGVDIMKKGGNAIDAAIAVQFALAVVYPIAGNIGGGGFMVYRRPDGESFALDYREMAPKAASEDMYQDSLGNVIPKKSTHGFLAGGIPGTVDGMDQAFQRFSKLKDWKALLEPAIKLAEEGFYPNADQVQDILYFQADIKKYSPKENAFTGDISVNKKIVQPELAKVLKAIAEKGK
jgi:gamma-glutamyltranspeptidase/glutathione hydrolase